MKGYKELMDAVLKKEVEAGNLPGASALVLHQGKEIYYGAFGMADMEEGRPMKRDTIIRMFSMTKPVTAVAVMILVERGLIDLHDPIAYYLLEFADTKVWKDGEEVALNRPITIWDLLNMTTGIPYPEDWHEPGKRMGKLFGELVGRRLAGEKVTTRDYVREIAKIPTCFQPGEKWMYGLSADILGAMVEAVSGMTYGEFLKKEIFEPLDMKDTGFFVPKEKQDRFAQIYLYDQKQGKIAPSLDCHLAVYYGEDVAFESGGAGLVSTLDDYSHFAVMLSGDGSYNGKRILGSRTVQFMRKDALSPAQKENAYWNAVDGFGYGCLMRTLLDPVTEGVLGNEGAFGWDGWTGNFVVMDPKDELVFLYFVQRGD
ncbi:MAG: beta-lactamase family protein, partial [Lachnospiraceae bacterium]|nr:beta-lactamase family protein [Lachnospiraceae bacterium]